MRTFIAVNLETPVRERISAGIRDFPVNNPPWRWTRPETWHITLKFLGDISDPRLETVEKCLEQVSRRHTAFELALGDFGGFPNLRKPRVLFFAAVTGGPQLAQLAADVNRTLKEGAGFPEEHKRFHPHVTIARIKAPLPGAISGGISSVLPLENAVQTVCSIDLMKSELRREGAVYSRLKGFALPPLS